MLIGRNITSVSHPSCLLLKAFDQNESCLRKLSPCLAEQEDAVRAAAVKGDTAALVAHKLMPEAKDGNSEFIMWPDFDGTHHDRGIGRIEPFKEQSVLLAIGNARNEAPQVLENAQQN